MRWPYLLGSCVLAVVLVAAGRGTGALWNDSANLGAGTIRSGTLTLLVGANGTEVKSYAFDGLSATNLGPGSYVQAPLSIRNGGTTKMTYRLSSFSLTPAALQSATTLTSTVGGSCPAQGAPSGPSVDLATARPLAPGAAEQVCLQLTLRSDAPQAGVAGTGSTNNTVLTFAAVQVR